MIELAHARLFKLQCHPVVNLCNLISERVRGGARFIFLIKYGKKKTIESLKHSVRN